MHQLTDKPCENYAKRNGTVPLSQKSRVDMVINDVSQITGMAPDILTSRERGTSKVSRARFLIYLCLVKMGLGTRGTSRWMRKDHSSVIHGISEIEKINDLAKLGHIGNHELETLEFLKQLKKLGYRI